MTSQFDISLEDSVVLLKRVLPMMSERKVPTIPQNYAVWFDYIARNNPELCDQLDAHDQSGLGFSPGVCRDFYERFFMERLREEVDELRGSMQEAVESVLFQLNDLEGGMHNYSEVLKNSSEKLTSGLSPEQIDALIGTLVNETNTARNASQEVSSTLHSMSDELTELRAQVHQLSRDSRTDALTGIPNRRAFNEVIDRMTDDCVGSGEALSLILVDIDHFKKFNDTHGHILASKSATFKPHFAACRAIPAPVMPPPTMARSKSWDSNAGKFREVFVFKVRFHCSGTRY